MNSIPPNIHNVESYLELKKFLETGDYKYIRKPLQITKIGRNDPCTCESGKKYKKCCGR